MIHRVLELPSVVTPESFRAAFPGTGFVFEGGGTILMGAEPTSLVRVARGGGGDPFAPLRAALEPCAEEDFPFAFRGGLVGYVGYECGQMLERLPNRPRPSLGLPDLAFARHDWVVGTRGGRSWLSSFVDPRPIVDRLRAPACPASLTVPRVVATSVLDRTDRLVGGTDRAAYEARVTAAREHILAGDAFEICLTTAFDAPFDRRDGWPLFRRLCAENPAPYGAFLDLPEGVVVSSSPERFVRLDRDGNAETRPIKGTRPRSADPAEDARLREDLATSEKDRAENVMIVDLSRNDLGKVCRAVTTPELYGVESYPTVHQLVSTVRGRLMPDKDAIDLLRACFPPGSMTGAPKIEAMRILEDLEPVERGPYAGALGWIDHSGAMDLSVVIRTAVITNDGVLRFAAGGAVTADSDPASEYEEMLAKTRALRAALDR